MKDVLDMGDYGVYVWSCYGLVLAVLVLNVWLGKRSLAEQVLSARRRLKIADSINSESSSPS
ncbi:heme exporter protein CcmD [Peristeroidobacter agariperforans]|uniref:heme exporter protein CcmD n=1 Tax=Peristeroidobacter agariperforans TaxID=268404 RepID=UPI001300B19F|nr:heme exporter protein CcmD [Peristeroidobacter agariperforans]